MFIELSATSNFTFLTGASHPEELIAHAASLGLPALAIADLNSVAGIVRAHVAAREIARKTGSVAAREIARKTGSVPRLIPAALIRLEDGVSLTVLPCDRAGWGRLCRLLSLGRLRAPKGDCRLGADDLLAWAEGMEMLLHPPEETGPAAAGPGGGAGGWLTRAERLARRLGRDRLALLMAPRYDGQDRARFDRLADLAHGLGLPPSPRPSR